MTKMIVIILFSLGLLFLIFMFIPWSFGAPFQSSSRKAIRDIIELAEIKSGDKIADLGSGTGKLVAELAKTGAEVHGYETSPFLIWLSKRRMKKLGLKNAFIHRENFWNADIKDFDVITIFQINFVMKKLEDKIKKESKKNVRVVSNTWKFSGREPVKSKSKVHLYRFNNGKTFKYVPELS